MKKQTALVTGASTGIGKAIALTLARHGYDIAVHYRHSQSSAEGVASEAQAIGVNAYAVCADLSSAEQAEKMVHEAHEQLGSLSVVVNNVGNWVSSKTSELTPEQWHEAISSNLNTNFYITRSAIPFLREQDQSRIVNIAAASAHMVKARDDNCAYMIAKTGVIIYTKSLAKELAAEGITANVIAPGIAENSFEYDSDYDDTMPSLPMKRPATLQEVADAAYFFVKPESQYITGQVLEVSGGWSL